MLILQAPVSPHWILLPSSPPTLYSEVEMPLSNGHKMLEKTWLSEEELTVLIDMSKSLVKPRNILHTLKKTDLNNTTTMKTIYSARHKYRVAEMAERCLTFLPLRSPPIPVPSHKVFAIGFVNGNHFVQVSNRMGTFLCHEY